MIKKGTKKEYSFLNKVIVFDNQGETIDRYTIIFQDRSYAGSSRCPTSPSGFYQHGEDIVFDSLDITDGDYCHLVDKDEIKTYNKANKHLGKYKTFNAMKRLPQEVLNCIKHDVEVVDICQLIENETHNRPRPEINEAFLRERLGFNNRQIQIAKQLQDGFRRGHAFTTEQNDYVWDIVIN